MPKHYYLVAHEICHHKNITSNHKQVHKNIITKDSKVVLDGKLGFYYHRFVDFKEDLIELENVGGKYQGNVGVSANVGRFDDCFIITKFMESKKMDTKSNALLLDISSLDSTTRMRAYLPKDR